MKNWVAYNRLIYKLRYLTLTRPHISYVVQHHSQFMQCPEISLYEATLRVFKYVKQQPGLGLMLSSYNNTNLYAYGDSDWARCVK